MAQHPAQVLSVLVQSSSSDPAWVHGPAPAALIRHSRDGIKVHLPDDIAVGCNLDQLEAGNSGLSVRIRPLLTVQTPRQETPISSHASADLTSAEIEFLGRHD